MACEQEDIITLTELDLPLDIEPYRDKIAGLPMRQRQCMLLVNKGYVSKDIARYLPISPRSVDKHILKARETVDKTLTRREVARLVAAYEAQWGAEEQGGQQLPPQTLPLPQTADPASGSLQDVMAGSPAATPARMEGRDPARFEVSVEALRRLVPLRDETNRPNELSGLSTLVACTAIAMMAVIAVGSTISLLNALQTHALH